jgi:hypothetical protein
MRITEFAPAIAEVSENPAGSFDYASPEPSLPWKAGHFSGRDFVPQADGSLRVLFAAKIRDCRGCQLREQCQWHGITTKKPRRVSLLLHPLGIGTAPVLVARIGVAGTRGGRPCSSAAANEWRCRWKRRAELILLLRL